MADIKNVKPGQVLYHPVKIKWQENPYYEVRVISIADDLQSAITSYNGNPPRKTPARYFKNYRLKRPNGRAKN